MILTESQISNLLKEPLNGDSIVRGSTLQKQHKVHITGEGYEGLVRQVDGFEGGRDFNIRKQVSKPATIQITSIILDNLNRWVNAQGTVKKVDFRDGEKNELFEDVLNQVWNGRSFDYFIKTFYKEAIYTEFNGFFLVTKPKVQEGIVDKEGILSDYDGEPLMPYIIFISVDDVHDYRLTGDKVEYLIIKLDDHIYRVIDDEKDIILTYQNDTISNELPIDNPLGYVPAIKVTNINDILLSSQVKTSPIAHIIPALDRYFSSDSDLRIQFIKHAYPKLAIVTKDCVMCGGTGSTYDVNTRIKCNTCEGSGKQIPISRDGVIGLPENLTQGDTAYPGSPASYITPDTDSLRLCIEDLDQQRKDILYSGTGDKGLIMESLREETATATIVSSRSLEDRISEISAMVEDAEVFLKDTIKKLYQPTAGVSEYSITVKYGRRVAVKGEDELIGEIKAAKEAGMPSSYVQSLQRDLIYSKYKNNVIELERQLLLSDVEPFSGYTVDELLKFQSLLNRDELYMKLNFDSLVDTFEEKYTLLDYGKEMDYKARVNRIKKELISYAILQEPTGGD